MDQEITLSSPSSSRSTIQSMGNAMCWDRMLLAAISTIHFCCPLAKEKSGLFGGHQSISGQARGARLEANAEIRHYYSHSS
jgi:hypothetical protein